MATYKEMYFHLFAMTENAINALIDKDCDLALNILLDAQIECEEMFLECDDPDKEEMIHLCEEIYLEGDDPIVTEVFHIP